MSPKSWQEALRADLQRLEKDDRPTRLAVLGIGHELYGDDAIGIKLVETLQASIPAVEDLLALVGGSAPENLTGALRRFQPDMVLLVDAALMGLPPGQAAWLDWRNTTGFSASTHTLPLHILASFLESDLGCTVALLGIQPERTDCGAPLSPAVQKTAMVAARSIQSIMKISTTI